MDELYDMYILIKPFYTYIHACIHKCIYVYKHVYVFMHQCKHMYLYLQLAHSNVNAK